MGEQVPITDSPWFWVLLFSLVGLASLTAISGQYGKRQARLERQYQARERVAEEAVGDPDRREYATPAATLIPIWPLAAGLGAVVVLAGVMLGANIKGGIVNLLVDNELAIWIAGALMLVAAAVAFFMRRTPATLAVLTGVVAITAAMLVVEHLVETPREAVERTLYCLAQLVEDDDVATAITFIAPGASQIRSDVEVAMPLVRIEKANVIGTPEIDVDMSRQPPTATVNCKGFIQGTLKRDGMTGGEFAELVITFVQVGDRWLVQDYTSSRDWHRAATGGAN